MTDYSIGRAHHPGPYHPSWEALRKGDWVLWAMPTFVKTGRVILRTRTSLVVHFQAHPHVTVIPDAYQYWRPTMPQDIAHAYVMYEVPKPEHLLPDAVSETVTVRQAAALLGCGSKDVRRMLRAGQIKGRREEGRWVEVEADSLNKAAARAVVTD